MAVALEAAEDSHHFGPFKRRFQDGSPGRIRLGTLGAYSIGTARNCGIQSVLQLLDVGQSIATIWDDQDIRHCICVVVFS